MNKTTESKKMNPILWILFAVIIPLFVVGLIAVFVLEIAGIGVVDWAKEKTSQVPVVGELIQEEEPEEVSSEENEQSQMQLQQKEDEIIELENVINDLELTNNQLEDEILRLEHRNESNENTGEAAATEEDSTVDMIQSFTEMKGNQAAQILETIEDESLVVQILQGMEATDRGEIMQRMSPEVAATYTELIMADMEN